MGESTRSVVGSAADVEKLESGTRFGVELKE